MSTPTHVAALPVLTTKIETFAKCNVILSNSPTGNTILNLVSSICIGIGWRVKGAIKSIKKTPYGVNGVLSWWSIAHPNWQETDSKIMVKFKAAGAQTSSSFRTSVSFRMPTSFKLQTHPDNRALKESQKTKFNLKFKLDILWQVYDVFFSLCAFWNDISSVWCCPLVVTWGLDSHTQESRSDAFKK